MSTVHVVVPDGLDDPARPSGGNTYDRRICIGLGAIGWSVHELVVPGSWPWPDAGARAALGHTVAALPDQAVVLLDGLIASAVPDLLVPESGRLRLVVLVHMPLGAGQPADKFVATRERAVLSCAAAVVTTSAWTRRWLLEQYTLAPERIYLAEPGVGAAELASGTADGGQLLCVAAVTRSKGHDVLLAALATVADLPWRCVCAGTLTREAAFLEGLRHQARAAGLHDRILLAGPLGAADLDAAYAGADLLVLASHAETYGMVVTEALARGLPVVATAVGGLPEALGHGTDGGRPGLLVPAGDPAAFGAALRHWLSDPELRQQLRLAARQRRDTLPAWSQTSRRISHALSQVAMPTPAGRA